MFDRPSGPSVLTQSHFQREIKLNLVGKLEVAENDYVIFVVGPSKSWFTGIETVQES